MLGFIMVVLIIALVLSGAVAGYVFGINTLPGGLSIILSAALSLFLMWIRRKISNDSRVAEIYLRLRSFFSSPANLFVVALMVTAFGASWALGAFGPPPNNFGPTILVGSVALGGWLFTSGINLQNRVSQFTLSILFGPRLDKTMLEAAKLVFQKHPEKVIVMDDIKKILDKGNVDSTLELRAAISTVSNYYEALALAVRHREADEVVLRLFYRGMLSAELVKYQHYIIYYRAEVSERAFCNWEWLVRRWEGASLDALDAYRREKRSH
ncbi:DUF4760 domain-containing protein [Nitrospirillum amazonense]|uniref:DUF4760 domain-containing protein n=1 Tax=Nitrospirillum amazonense TaxID=28077 RepID=UPI002DD44A86|nr:DUF4760 domain-containing protein [Nitrospirillum amazonense]MEC4594016.1 DUF4760 domain-containing protein [Nitrospirillum amazonense]